MEQLGDLDKSKEYFEKASLGTEELAGGMYYNDQPADMILYQGLAKQKLGNASEAIETFQMLIDYGVKHLADDIRIEYFAVSLPDFLIFEEDLTLRNQAHCYYLIGLGNLGLGRYEDSSEAFEKALALDQNHMNCLRYRKDIKNR
jgi:tetratricopeptide (TPR) repeat protein